MEMKSISDWEMWVKLYREDPQEFEKARVAAIEELIMNQPESIRRRSRQLQWRIDAVRRRAPNSLASCIRIYDMMMESVYGPGGLIEVINSGWSEIARSEMKTGKGAVRLKLVKREKPSAN